MLVLDAAILAIGANFIPVVDRPAGTALRNEQFTLLGVVYLLFWVGLVAAIDWWICRKVLRTVNMSLPGASVPPPQTSGMSWKNDGAGGRYRDRRGYVVSFCASVSVRLRAARTVVTKGLRRGWR